jgi:hypothetical protein
VTLWALGLLAGEGLQTVGDVNIPLNVTQLIMLGGVVYGLARMSKSVDVLSDATAKLTTRLEYFGTVLSDMVSRVRVLEDRGER